MMPLIRQATGRIGTVDVERLALDYYDVVFRFCARRVGHDRAADAAQEAFVTAWRVRQQFRGESSVTTWLLGIAHNECRRLSRKYRLDVPLVEWLASGDSHECELVDREALRAAMADLSLEHREVVLMHEIDGLTYDEIAVILEIPCGTVKSRLHHAFLNLRKAIVEPMAEVAQ